VLQYGHHYAPFLNKTHPHWSEWLDGSGSHHRSKEDEIKIGRNLTSVTLVVQKFTERLEKVDQSVKETFTLLQSNGFSNPSFQHVLQTTKDRHVELPNLLIYAAVTNLWETTSSLSNQHKHQSEKRKSTRNIQPLFRTRPRDSQSSKKNISTAIATRKDQESFGAWGFDDSGFLLQIDEKGSRNVMMKGHRYSFSNRRMPHIVNFLEREMSITINPSQMTLPLPTDIDNDCLPPCAIGTSGLSQLQSLFNHDHDSTNITLSTNVQDRIRHGTGHTQEDMYKIRTHQYHDFRVPDVVVWPSTDTDVQTLIQLASVEDWCLIPFGGGTNVTHATWCPSYQEEPRPIISVDMKCMNKVLWINDQDGTAHVQAGITGRELCQALEAHGWTMGHEPDSYEFSTLGGWIATKASGMKQNKYGNIEDIVLNVKVAGSEGRLCQPPIYDSSTTLPHPYEYAYGRVSTGMDLTSLMLGSEGCLGIITSAIIKIWPLPEEKEYDSILFSDFQQGVDFVRDISKCHLCKPASVRLVDNAQLHMAKALSDHPSFWKRLQEASLTMMGSMLYQFSSDSMVAVTITYEGKLEDIHWQKSKMTKLASKHGGIRTGPKMGKSGYDLTFAIAYLRDFALSYNILAESFETFVPWSQLVSLVQLTKERIEHEYQQRLLPGRPMISARVTQLYDNGACVYFYFCMSGEGIQDPSRVYSEIEHAARDTIMKAGGSLSHHQ